MNIYEVMYFTLLLDTREEKQSAKKYSDVFVRSNIHLLSVRYEHMCLQRHRHGVFTYIYRY